MPLAAHFLGCTKYSKEASGCKYSSAIGDDADNTDLSGDGKKIGKNPKTGDEIYLKVGRYGRYLEIKIQAGETDKLKRTSIPKILKMKK